MFAFRPLGGLREERSTHLAQYLNTDVQFVKLLISREVRYIYAVSLNSVRTCEVTQFLIFYISYFGDARRSNKCSFVALFGNRLPTPLFFLHLPKLYNSWCVFGESEFRAWQGRTGGRISRGIKLEKWRFWAINGILRFYCFVITIIRDALPPINACSYLYALWNGTIECLATQICKLNVFTQMSPDV